MPIPAALIPSIIQGGAALVGGGIQAAATGSQNKRSLRFQKRLYERQYEDALNFWNLQNEYNSPQAQMKRLQEAGLNPNMVYGGSSGGTAGTAGSIPVPDVQSPQFRVPEFGNAIANAGSLLANYMDFEIKQAQVDNLKAQNSLIYEDILYRAAQRDNVTSSTQRSLFDLEYQRDIRSLSIEQLRENLRRTRNEVDVLLSRNEREAITTASNLKEAGERILSMRETRANTVTERSRIREAINNLRKDTQLKEIDAMLWQQGISKSDPLYVRFFTRYLQSRFPDLFSTADRADLSFPGRSLPPRKDVVDTLYKLLGH